MEIFLYLKNIFFSLFVYLKKSIFSILILFSISYLLLRKLKTKFSWELPHITLKAFFQLVFISIILTILIKINFKYAFIVVVAVICFNAAKINLSRFPINELYERKKLFRFLWGLYFVVNFISFIIIYPTGFFKFSPEVIIPLVGISVAGAMRGINLLISTLFNKVNESKDILEAVFALGGSQKDALNLLKEEVLSYSTLNTRDMFKAAGIVHIPGVMVGLLLAGANPIKAAIVQFLVLNLILFNVVISSFFVFRYFTKYFPYQKFFLILKKREE